MSISPVIHDPWPWIILVALPLLGAVLAWRANHSLPAVARVPLTVMRGAAFASIAVLLLNPGRWREPQKDERSCMRFCSTAALRWACAIG